MRFRKRVHSIISQDATLQQIASKCSCMMAGNFCTTLCHKGRGKNNFYTLFADLDDYGEDESSQVAWHQVTLINQTKVFLKLMSHLN